ADHTPELAEKVCRGRAEFLAQFPSVAQPDVQACLPDPADPATFERCKLDPAERDRHAPTVDLHRDLLRLRRTEPAFRVQRAGGVRRGRILVLPVSPRGERSEASAVTLASLRSPRGEMADWERGVSPWPRPPPPGWSAASPGRRGRPPTPSRS